MKYRVPFQLPPSFEIEVEADDASAARTLAEKKARATLFLAGGEPVRATEFTRGEWAIMDHQRAEVVSHIETVSGSGECRVAVLIYRPEWRKNGQLIAAAPKMLAALLAVQEAVMDWYTDEEDADTSHEEREAKAREALGDALDDHDAAKLVWAAIAAAID